MLALDSHLSANGMQMVPAFPLFNVCERERQTLGFDHTEAGGLLAANWGLPSTLAAAITHHHRPWDAPADQNLVAAVMVGDVVAQMVADGLQPEAWPEVLEYLAPRGLVGDDLRSLTESVVHDPEEMLARATRAAGTPCQPLTPASIS